MATFGEQLRDALERRHMEQGELADLLGVSVRAVNDWVNDRSKPRNRMGALKAWAPELGGEDPGVVEIRELGDRLGLTTAEQDEWIAKYQARKPPPGERRAG